MRAVFRNLLTLAALTLGAWLISPLLVRLFGGAAIPFEDAVERALMLCGIFWVFDHGLKRS